jgi:Cysteine-rich CPCC
VDRGSGPFPCPCCGYLVFAEAGFYEICPICGWEDDTSQLRFPETHGANHVSLIEAQRNFAALGARDESYVGRRRRPLPTDKRDPLWRPLDLALDDIERPAFGVGYVVAYPPHYEDLFYWRSGYWRPAPGTGADA